MVTTLQPHDLIEVHKKLSANWNIQELSVRNYDISSHKRQRLSAIDSNHDSRHNGGGLIPRMTRIQSKNMMTRLQSISKDSDMIPGNPLTSDSHYINNSLKDNNSYAGELALRQHFSNSLLDAFVTK